MNIILTGMRGTGKTTLGRLLAKKLESTFIDLDDEIEKDANEKIADIVKKYGWNYFRKLEKKITKRIAESDGCIIATGGGTLMDETNAKMLKKNGMIIVLKCSCEIIRKRLKNDTSRPALQSHKTIHSTNFLDELENVWNERKNTYIKTADLILKNETKHDEIKCLNTLSSLAKHNNLSA
ncbi:shikimate kinase [Candidatus Peregrinibacteria bacterium]|nr:shikimate kinase [Candidatus Peregrinibacteria bacterium]